ncbi:hypothetical protein SAMN05443144_12061 [Fodinibius roseus]|uniref:Uncharacterized protein n=1 Tax=Fodinibius roseus TaxID=1194090 RepID=A0A1M5HJL6_9BACT|nr:clostripain-related cysteine peptidase [Fodinibius roseus]SHG16098.1 hypothetical protein SAMN05443144_12061 [Fodinibius roseus]
MIIRSYLFITGLLSVMLLGCVVQKKAVRPAPPGSSAAGIDYTLIYLLHGDADYLYHSEEGQPLQADEEVLKEAQSVAEKAENGEVFIFHQRPEQKVLGLFPKKDRRMYHYRNGELVSRRAYSPAPGKEGEGEGERAAAFDTEATLYETLRSPDGSNSRPNRILLYYGHEIPMLAQTGYHRSRPEVDFGSSAFTDGIAQFNTSGSSPLDLLVLSTCNNGTPDMLHRLKDTADYVLASPQNLHLSHIDSDALLLLESRASIGTADLAAKIADQTLGRMSKFIQTGVTLSLYDTDIAGKYAADLSLRITERTSRNEHVMPAGLPAADTGAVNTENTETLTGPGTGKEMDTENTETGPGAARGTENIDCAELLPAPLIRSDGISVWFQPPAFGPQAARKSHSGWGCVNPMN